MGCHELVDRYVPEFGDHHSGHRDNPHEQEATVSPWEVWPLVLFLIVVALILLSPPRKR
jgi:hypothetical protein